MIGHQAPGQDSQGHVLEGFRHHPQKGEVVAVGFKDRPPLVAAVQDVKDKAARGHASGSWHSSNLPKRGCPVNNWTYPVFLSFPLPGRKALVGKREMARVGRAVEKGETEGFMKILVDAETKAILGASLLGTECDEVVHSILDVMYARAPYTVIQRAMHIHPTVTELIPTMLGELKPLE